jgi:HSP20 family protein
MPILQIDPFSAAFDTAFDQSVLFNNAKKAKRTWQPTFVHIEKTGEKFSILIDVPGVKQEDMQMQLTAKNQTLLLSGIRKFHAKGGSEEVDEAKFEKRFNIGHDVDVEKITANLSDGVLKITAPKKAAPSPVTIPIQVGPKA